MSYTINELKANRDKAAAAVKSNIDYREKLKLERDQLRQTLYDCKWRKNWTQSWVSGGTIGQGFDSFSDDYMNKYESHPSGCATSDLPKYRRTIPQMIQTEKNLYYTVLEPALKAAQLAYDQALNDALRESNTNLYQQVGSGAAAKETQTNVSTIAMAVIGLLVLFVAVKLILN